MLSQLIAENIRRIARQIIGESVQDTKTRQNIAMLLSLQCIMLHSPSLGASRAVRVLPRGSDKFEPKLHLLLPFPSTLPPCALLFFCHFLHCACSRVCNQRTGLDTQASGIVRCGALSSQCASLTESCQQCCECSWVWLLHPKGEMEESQSRHAIGPTVTVDRPK